MLPKRLNNKWTSFWEEEVSPIYTIHTYIIQLQLQDLRILYMMNILPWYPLNYFVADSNFFFHVKAWVLLVLIGFYSWILTLNSLAYIFCWFLLSVTKLITPVFLIKPILSCYWIFSPSRTMPSGELTWREGLWKHCTRHATLTTKDTVYGAGLLTSFGLEMMLSQNLILTIQKPFCILGTWWNLLITISMFLLAGNICFTLISTNNFKFFPTSIYI